MYSRELAFIRGSISDWPIDYEYPPSPGFGGAGDDPGSPGLRRTGDKDGLGDYPCVDAFLRYLFRYHRKPKRSKSVRGRRLRFVYFETPCRRAR